ncbi:tetratricopeptide repeat protein 16-like [Mobula hypostoma]|uniref:tetratricopeptide repeat protein 16-like n=1 Tax=Mobula hypostoma TaxID=723540 RepID=UPI002FC2B9C0
MEHAREEEQNEESQYQTLAEEDPIILGAGVFPTALSEEQLAAATEKARQDLFGSSKIFHLDAIEKKNYVMSDIINNRAEEHYEKGKTLVNMGLMEEAIISFNKALNLDPRRKEFHLRKAEAYLYIGDFQSSVLNYRMASNLDPADESLVSTISHTLYIHGQYLFEVKMYGEALEIFALASELRPANQHYHMRSIATLLALGRLEDCLQYVTKQLEVVPSNADLYILRARLQDHFSNVVSCYRDVSHALSLDPSHPEAVSLMATLKLRAEEAKARAVNKALEGNMNGAFHCINKAIDNNPVELDYYIFRGTLYRRVKNFNAAIDDYLLVLDKVNDMKESETYLETQRQLLLTYNDFAVHCYHRGFYEEAVLLLNQSIKEEKQEKGLYINRGDCFLKQCNLDFALLDYEQAQELDPEDWRIQIRIAAVNNEKGLLSHQNRNYQEAEERFTTAIEGNPCMSQYYLNRAKTRQILRHVTGSQEDAVTSLLLDIRNKQIIPLLTHLFPGKSVDEIMASRIMESARLKLNTSFQAAAALISKVLQQRHSFRTVPKAQSNKTLEADKEGQKSASGFVPCISEKDLYDEIIARRNMLTQEIKRSLHERKPLQVNRPRLQMVRKPTENASQTSEDASQGKPYKWRKFGSLFAGGT